MELRVLGRTGVNVSKFCFGAGMFGYFGNDDKKECQKMVDHAIEEGINYFDTSDVYSHGESENILGDALKKKRKDVILATKFSLPMDSDPNHKGNSRRWIMEAVENSLDRLKTDYIDLYQVHRPDITTDIDETLGALSDLMRQGKVRMIGTSTFPAEQIVEAQWCSEKRMRERFSTEQAPYSIFARKVESNVFPTCQKYGIGGLVWSPLAQGWLTGKWRRGSKPEGTHRNNLQPHLFQMDRTENQMKLDLIERLEKIAGDAGLSLIAMALAFTTEHPAVSSVIIGPRTFDQLAGLLNCSNTHLDEDTLDAIDLVVPPGQNISSDDDGYTPPAIEDRLERRRLKSSPKANAGGQTMDNIENYKKENRQ
ncbi:MAG: aldo/keto reductase [Gammaproteobacteria bacterium]|nr:aldo/keto reductase [Gammaproteobacteria bacterium]